LRINGKNIESAQELNNNKGEKLESLLSIVWSGCLKSGHPLEKNKGSYPYSNSLAAQWRNI